MGKWTVLTSPLKKSDPKNISGLENDCGETGQGGQLVVRTIGVENKKV